MAIFCFLSSICPAEILFNILPHSEFHSKIQPFSDKNSSELQGPQQKMVSHKFWVKIGEFLYFKAFSIYSKLSSCSEKIPSVNHYEIVSQPMNGILLQRVQFTQPHKNALLKDLSNFLIHSGLVLLYRVVFIRTE